MSVLEAMGLNSIEFFKPHFNTGMFVDYQFGKYYRGFDNRWYLNGGLNWMGGVIGRPQHCKSNLSNAIIARLLGNYSDSEGCIFDTEYSMSDPTILDVYAGCRVSDRVALITPATHDMESFHEMIKQTCEYRMKHIKDYQVEYPFMNPKTNKPYVGWRPFFISIDSWTRLASSVEFDKIDNNDISDGKMNTLFMEDAKKKSILIKDLITRAAKYGLFIITTAHVGNSIQMDQYQPNPKDLTFMKANDKTKSVGREFHASILWELQNVKSAPLHDKDKKSLYPNPNNMSPDDLLEVHSMAIRGKQGGGSGVIAPIIISQQNGYDHAVTNYHYLRSNDYVGLEGNNVTHRCVLKPDVTLKRTNVMDVTRGNYELSRALELTAQYVYVQKTWSQANCDIDMSRPVEEFASKLLDNKKTHIADVLNSRGYWTYNKKEERPYMSLFDTVELAFSA